ncbi:hypothetical protein [Streptomyces sp. NPDC058307]|uniref:hypothetical protein n=1 Tax=Streptomyces sp. NPDC058307 TaxID=3346439 RepID=UPI0036EB6572
MAEAPVEDLHGGAASDTGEHAPQEVGGAHGVGGEEERGAGSQDQAADLSEEGDGGGADAARQQTAGGGGTSRLERSRELGDDDAVADR